MSRVEWTLRSGEDVEGVIGVLLCREFPRARRIRPSQGDGGRDVLVPDNAGHEVYQVKKFAANLTPTQKRQIAASYDRILGLHTSGEIVVTQWHLTMPLNPTPENERWFAELTSAAPFPCDWRGLDYIEGLVAKYPEVVDYYFNNGRDRLDQCVQQLLGILRLRNQTATIDESSDTGLQPAEVTNDLQNLYNALNGHDPHYRYEFHVGEHRDAPSLPDLVAVYQQSNVAGGPCVSHFIFSRFDEAVIERPVPVQLEIAAEPGSQLAADLESFVTYGTPLQTPVGAASFETDLPGGIGGRFEGGSVFIGPARLDGAEPYLLRLQVLDESDVEISTVRLEMQPASRGLSGRGSRVYGTEENGVFDIEILFNFSEDTFRINLTAHDIQGRSPVEVLPALRFLEAFHAPNSFRVARAHGPFFADQLVIPSSDNLIPPLVLQVVDALALIQEHTTEQLVVPPPGTRLEVLEDVLLNARLLRGETVSVTWSRLDVVLGDAGLAPLDEVGSPFSFMVDESAVLNLDSNVIELGRRRFHVGAARVADAPETLDSGDHHVRLVPAGNDQGTYVWLDGGQSGSNP